MDDVTSAGAALWPAGVYFAAVMVVVAGQIALSYFLGERHRAHAAGEPYEGRPLRPLLLLRGDDDCRRAPLVFVLSSS